MLRQADWQGKLIDTEQKKVFGSQQKHGKLYDCYELYILVLIDHNSGMGLTD